MKIGVEVAAAKLKVTNGVIRRFIEGGVLTDYKPHNPANKRHVATVDSQEVNKLAKVYRPRMTPDVAKLMMKSLDSSNGHVRVTPLDMAAAPLPPRTEPLSTPTGLITRLDRIEAKLDQLLEMWK
jgi:hypothetical protein